MCVCVCVFDVLHLLTFYGYVAAMLIPMILRRSAGAGLLESRILIPLGACIFVAGRSL